MKSLVFANLMMTLMMLTNFTGCSNGDNPGPSSDSQSIVDQPPPSVEPETDLKQNLVGSWLGPCHPDLGKFFQQRIDFFADGSGRSTDSIFEKARCQSQAVSQDSAKAFSFRVVTQTSPRSGALRMQAPSGYAKEVQVKFDGDQPLLTADGITLRLSKTE